MAPEAEEEDFVFYPAFCFKASPTHLTWVKMAGADVHRLRRRRGFEDQGIYFYNNHPIRFVSLVGIIVARTEVQRCTILTLDDSSGATVEVVVFKTPTPPRQTQPRTHNANAEEEAEEPSPAYHHRSTTTKSPLDITRLVPGGVARLKGTLSTYRSAIQLQLELCAEVFDTNAEMEFLDARVRFLVEVLAVPWVLTEQEIEALRVEADREEERVDVESRRAERNRRKRAEREERDRKRILKRWEWEEREREREAEECRAAGVKLMRDMDYKDV